MRENTSSRIISKRSGCTMHGKKPPRLGKLSNVGQWENLYNEMNGSTPFSQVKCNCRKIQSNHGYSCANNYVHILATGKAGRFRRALPLSLTPSYCLVMVGPQHSWWYVVYSFKLVSPTCLFFPIDARIPRVSASFNTFPGLHV